SFDLLGRLVAIGRNKSLRLLLLGCRTPEHVCAFLNELDQPVTGRLDELARMSLSWRDREKRDTWRELAIFSLTREDRPARDRQDEGFTGARRLCRGTPARPPRSAAPSTADRARAGHASR